MNKKMIYVLNHYSKDSVQHFYHVLHLLERIADHGVEIALIIEKCDDEPEILHKNIRVYAQKETQKLKRALELYLIVNRLVKEQKYGKIFVRISKYAAIISCVAGHKYGAEIYYWLSGASFGGHKELPFFEKAKWYMKDYSSYYLVKSMIDYFVTGPEYMVDYYATEGCVRRKKLRLLYNDIDTERFRLISYKEKRGIRKKLGISSDKICILLVHRLSGIRKTHYYMPCIVKFMKAYSDIELIIIGDGPEEETIRNKIRDADNINMVGAQPNATIEKYYQACDIFINPSACEGFPRVILEAMACGKPVVATAAGGTRDLFGKVQLPYIVGIEDRDEFVKALKKMVDDENLRNECGRENLNRADRYSTEKVAEMYINVLWNEKR